MSQFNTIGIIGKPHDPNANISLQAIVDYLLKRECTVLVEQSIAGNLRGQHWHSADMLEIGDQADLAIVVGGDGSMLSAARVLSRFNVAVVGVNRGNLGFLTDIDPEDVEAQLEQLFNGQYATEQRFILEAEVIRHGVVNASNAAVNEAVLHAGKVARMIEFEVYIDEHFMFSQRSDGLIVATPTGSTAYSLSGGGPIMTPNLDAVCMVPMFPHTLSSRPIVVDGNSTVCLKVSDNNAEQLQVSCDGHVTLSVLPGDIINIRKSPHRLSLLHPHSYNYFNVLRNKLGWGSKLY